MSEAINQLPPEITAAFDDQIRVPRVLITVGGGLLAGALLAQGLLWTAESNAAGAEGWFYSTFTQWEEAAGLNQADLTKAANKLEHRGLLSYRWFGERKYMRVNVETMLREIEQIGRGQRARVMAAEMVMGVA